MKAISADSSARLSPEAFGRAARSGVTPSHSQALVVTLLKTVTGDAMRSTSR
jgi:hypothetical protein